MGRQINWEQVGEYIEKIKEQQLTYTKGAELFDIPVWQLYEYNRRQNRNGGVEAERKVEAGVSEAREESGNREVVASASAQEGKGEESDGGMGDETFFEQSSLPEEIQRLIITYRQKNPHFGFKRIEDYLKSDHLIVVRRKQIRQVLKAHGLLEVNDSSFDRPEEAPKGSRRFEAAAPGELYQMDVTYVYLSKISVLYLAVIVDDYSRFCLGAELCHDQRGETLIGVLHNACLHHGFPRKLLTDQGSGFYTWSENQTQFQRYLDEQGIEHIVCEPHSPQTQGKVERLNQTIKQECLTKRRFGSFAEAQLGISDFIRRYNFGRPHQGIKGFRPADRFYGVVEERACAEEKLLGKEIDLSKGYCIFKVQDHCVSVVSSGEGIQVYLDGKLLREALCDER